MGWVVTNTDLLDWLRGKLADAEKAMAARKEMEATWRSGNDREWKAAGCRLNSEQRLMESAKQGRIATKCQREIEMFKAAIDALKP